MTEPTTAKMMTYSTEDGTKAEAVRVAIAGLSLRATGYVVSTESPAYGASYSIGVHNDGRTRRITVRCDNEAGERSLSLTRSPGGPWIAESVSGSIPQPDIDDAVDVYVTGSAFSASLPVRRLGLHTEVGREASVTVASISLPDLTVTPVIHSGRNVAVSADGAEIAYSGSYGERTVFVDSDGIFLRSVGLVTRVS